MADFNTLSGKIVSKVAEVTELSDSGQVFDYEPNIESIEKDPFATVTPSGNENDFVSSAENRRTYAFSIRIYVERKSRGSDGADNVMRTIIDSLIDKFDNDYTLTGSAILVLAAPSAWGYLMEPKEYRVAEIKLHCKTDFTLTP